MRVSRVASGLVVGTLIFLSLLMGGFAVSPVKAALTPGWQMEMRMPEPKAQAEITVGADGMIYVFGGVDSIDSVTHEYNAAVDTAFVYDPVSGGWAQIESMPVGARSGVAIAGEDGRIYVFGGYNETYGALDDTQIYDPVTDSWSTGALMPYWQSFVSGARGEDGRMYLIGGTNGAGNMQIYDPVYDIWSLGTNMLEARWAGTCVSMGSEIWYLGGSLGWDSASSVCMAYYIYGNSWSYLPSLPMPLAGLTGVLGVDGLIYVFGGSNTAYNTGGLLPGQEFYDVAFSLSWFNDTWFPVESIPYNCKYAMSAATDDGRIWFTGGNNNTDVYGGLYSLEVMRVTVTLSSTTVAQGESLMVTVTPEFAYLDTDAYGLVAYLVMPTGVVLPVVYVYTAVAAPFAFVMPVPQIAEIGDYQLVMINVYAATEMYYSVALPDMVRDFTVIASIPLDEQIALLEASIAALAAQLDGVDANLSALQADIDSLQNQVTTLQSSVTSGNNGLSAKLVALNSSVAALQDKLDALEQAQTDTQDKVDTKMSNTMGYVNLILLVIVIVLLALMMFGRKSKPPPPP